MGSIPTRSRHPGRLPAALAATAALLVALAAAPGPALAQEADTVEAEPAAPPAEPDTADGPPISPLGAFARSVVVPGWGQAEVDQPLRGGFYFAAQAASLWMVVKTQSKLSSAERSAGDLGPGEEDPLVESRTSQRENWIVLSVFVALMSGVDAWVSTHLHDFEGELEPPEDGTAGARLRYSVPLDLP